MQWLIILALIIGVYYFFIKKPAAQKAKHDQKGQKEEIMLECSRCGLYISSQEVIIQDGEYFCSKECLHQGP